MRQDDGIGPYIVEILSKEIKKDNVIFLDCDIRPENYIDRIKGYNPAKIFVIDAADFGGEIGEVRVIPVEDIDGYTLSSHTMPISLFVYLLKQENIEVEVIGIQKKSISYDKPISNEIVKVINKIKEKIKQICGIYG